jgi:spore coat protein CotF
MMQERDIVNDILAGAKTSINTYTTAIMECSNQQLRSTLQTLRNEAEQMQYQLYQIAEQKGYYKPAPPANKNDVNQIKNTLTSAANSTTTTTTNTNQQMQ